MIVPAIAATILSRLQDTFKKLERLEGHPGEHSDIEWVALLALRERADPLTDDSWMRGYVVGLLDAVGVSTEEALQVLRTTTKGPRPRRRVVQLKKTG